jgi:CarD family transcriptional regulator
MTYQVNETILHSAGICRITAIDEKEMGGVRTEYYVLKPLHDDKTVVYVPVHNERATCKMRRILSAEEIYALIAAMPEEDTIWIENEGARHERYKEILGSGDRKELVRLIKTLYAHRKPQEERGKKVPIADDRMMKDAEKILYEEFAHVLHITPEQVIPFITRQIELAEREKND